MTGGLIPWTPWRKWKKLCWREWGRVKKRGIETGRGRMFASASFLRSGRWWWRKLGSGRRRAKLCPLYYCHCVPPCPS